MRAAVVTVGVGVRLGASALAGEFNPGHVYVSVEEFEVCDFGGQEAILEIDPVTGETSIFADSSDGICVGSGLAFTPDGWRLRLWLPKPLPTISARYADRFRRNTLSRAITYLAHRHRVWPQSTHITNVPW